MNAVEFLGLVSLFDVSKFGIPARLTGRLTSDDTVEVLVRLEVRDVETSRLTTVHSAQQFSPITLDRMSRDGAQHLVFKTFQAAILHEVDECVFFDGKPMSDPHKGEKRMVAARQDRLNREGVSIVDALKPLQDAINRVPG